jgi:hypothetical protein
MNKSSANWKKIDLFLFFELKFKFWIFLLEVEKSDSKRQTPVDYPKHNGFGKFIRLMGIFLTTKINDRKETNVSFFSINSWQIGQINLLHVRLTLLFLIINSSLALISNTFYLKWVLKNSQNAAQHSIPLFLIFVCLFLINSFFS